MKDFLHVFLQRGDFFVVYDADERHDGSDGGMDVCLHGHRHVRLQHVVLSRNDSVNLKEIEKKAHLYVQILQLRGISGLCVGTHNIYGDDGVRDFDQDKTECYVTRDQLVFVRVFEETLVNPVEELYTETPTCN